jgi:hypothetical protein
MKKKVYGRPGVAGTAGSLPLPFVRNQLITVHYSRENGEVYGRPGVAGTADHCTLF